MLVEEPALKLSAVGLTVPAVFHYLAREKGAPELKLDTEIARVLLLTYGVSLVFTLGTFEIVAIVVSVLSISFIAHDGETHWMEGVQLLAV